eukprot:750260-Hanusia_phi.AAC.2
MGGGGGERGPQMSPCASSSGRDFQFESPVPHLRNRRAWITVRILLSRLGRGGVEARAHIMALRVNGAVPLTVTVSARLATRLPAGDRTRAGARSDGGRVH